MANRTRFHSKYHKGFSLIELMIAGSLGLVVIGGMYTLFTTNQKIVRIQSNISQAQEKAIFALELITEDIRMAGWPGIYESYPPFDNPQLTGTSARYDTLVLNRKSLGELDCTGSLVANEAHLTHRYFVDPATSTLMCNSLASGKTVAVVGNVVAFKVRYGIDYTSGKCDTGLPNITTKDAEAQCMVPTAFVRGNELAAALQQTSDIHGESSQLIPVKALRLSIVVATEETHILSSPSSLAPYAYVGGDFFSTSSLVNLNERRALKTAVRTVGLRQGARGP